MKPEHYQDFREFLERACGIVLGENKQYLVASRLAPVMLEHGFHDLGELVAQLDRFGGGNLRAQVIEAMTTNETQFFRDNYPYAILKEYVFPELQKRRVYNARVWSAGCSSGQEAYSISMSLQEYNEQGGRLDGEVLGTDISPQIVEQASLGRYNSSAITRGLTDERRVRFFRELDPQTWEVRPEIKRRASFRTHNLLESFAVLGRFDVIFVRNVLIYFSVESRTDILARMAKTLNPGGYLIVGASESLARQADDYEMIRLPKGVIYQVRGN
ncbi:protein-glutamate O-methyltransferase CheR [Alkalilimnicola ehrlichii]|nr:protein-glutamate O-methyltransferase CheR [Alkalilimnicola ehrlichii]